MKNVKLYNKDCLALLKSMEDNSVDLIVTDPPYNIGYDLNKANNIKNRKTNDWDSQWKTEQEYLDWCLAWTKECNRVLKDGRMLVVFGTLKTDTFIKYKLAVDFMKPQNEIIWSYNWGSRKLTNFARKHEYAWCWSKGDNFLFNGDDVMVARKAVGFEGRKKGTIPTCVWEKNNHTMAIEFCKWHPTQKPIMILNRIIRGYTNPGDTVLDIFSGSGSTAVAALNSGRKFIGSELYKPYYEDSKERIRFLTNKENKDKILL